MAMLKKQFGPRLIGEAMQEAVDDSAMQAHFDETGARPAMQPKIEMQNGETWQEGQDVTVALSYEALPDIAKPDFSGITLSVWWSRPTTPRWTRRCKTSPNRRRILTTRTPRPKTATR